MNIDISSDNNDYYKFENLNCMAELGFHQCILTVTRVTEKINSYTCIDHIFIRIKYTSNIISFTYYFSITDHYVSGLTLKNTESKEDNIYNLKKMNWNTLLAKLSLAD